MNPFLTLLVFLIVVLAVLVVVFVVVMCSQSPEWIFTCLGVSKKYEVLKFLGIGMGGILLALQALASHKRAKAMEDAATAQAGAIDRLTTPFARLVYCPVNTNR